MILTDTGPLVALLNCNDPNHTAWVDAAKGLSAEPLLTTWPCLTEAMYLLHRAAGYSGQEKLWRLLQSRALLLHWLSETEIKRMAVLMDKYKDFPMDFADASLVAAAEQLGTRRIFALDRDFHVYRLADGTAMELVP